MIGTDSLRRIAYIIFIILGGLLLGYLAIKHLAVLLLPFCISWAIAFGMRPVSVFVAERTHLKLRVVRPILTLGAALSVISIAVLAVWQLSLEMWQMLTEFGEGEQFKGFIENYLTRGGVFDRFFSEFGTTLADVIYNLATSVLSTLFSLLSSFLSSIPRVFLFLIITLISTVYFSFDLERINSSVLSVLSPSAREMLKNVKNGILCAALKYIRSYLLIFLLTFVLMLLGLSALGIQYSLLLSLVISFFDLLPVIGVGTFLVPFGLIKLAVGNTYHGVGILILFVIQAIVRQIAEPKILGKSFGIHPVITLIVLYAGYTLFGIVGILLVPIFTVLLELVFRKDNTADVNKREVSK